MERCIYEWNHQRPVRKCITYSKVTLIFTYVQQVIVFLQLSVYEDVLPALKLWTSSEKKVFIYSSGSVEAQKLLFQHSVDGDLLQVKSSFQYSRIKYDKVPDCLFAVYFGSLRHEDRPEEPTDQLCGHCARNRYTSRSNSFPDRHTSR